MRNIVFVIQHLAKLGFQDPVTEEQNEVNLFLEAAINDLKRQIKIYHICSYIEEYNETHGDTIDIIKNMDVWRFCHKNDEYKSPVIQYCPFCGQKLGDK